MTLKKKKIYIVLVDRQIGGSESRYIGLYDEINKIQSNYSIKYIINNEIKSIVGEEVFKSFQFIELETKYGVVTESKKGLARFIKGARIFSTILRAGIRISNINKGAITQFIGYNGMLLSIPSLVRGRKIGYSIIGYESRAVAGFDNLPSIYNKRFIKFCIKRAVFIDVLGEEVYQNLMTAFSPSELRDKIYNNGTYVDTDLYIPSTKKKLISYVARFEPYKQPLLFLEVAECLLKIDDNLRFVMLGEGGELNKIKEFIQKKNMEDNVKLVVSGKPLEFLAESSVYMSLQVHENYPSRALLEAMSCENAIIATDVGYTSLLVSEKNGGLVDFDPMQIAHKVIRLINSDALELKMNASREEVVRNYSMNKYVNSLRSMYGDVV